MKVKELIEELKKCNPEAIVFVIHEDRGTPAPVEQIMDWYGDSTEYQLIATDDY